MEELKHNIVKLWGELNDPKATGIDLCCYMDEAGMCGGTNCDDCPLGSAAYLVGTIKKELGISD